MLPLVEWYNLLRQTNRDLLKHFFLLSFSKSVTRSGLLIKAQNVCQRCGFCAKNNDCKSQKNACKTYNICSLSFDVRSFIKQTPVKRYKMELMSRGKVGICICAEWMTSAIPFTIFSVTFIAVNPFMTPYLIVSRGIWGHSDWHEILQESGREAGIGFCCTNNFEIVDLE